MNNLDCKKIIDCVTSLHVAMDLAGGRILPTQELVKMSAIDLLCLIAPNNITFVYKKRDPHNPNDEDNYDPH